jgi:hypothetical protein
MTDGSILLPSQRQRLAARTPEGQVNGLAVLHIRYGLPSLEFQPGLTGDRPSQIGLCGLRVSQKGNTRVRTASNHRQTGESCDFSNLFGKSAVPLKGFR